MTLQNFENEIDSSILKRGKDYYDNQHVDYLEEIEKNSWVANVSGNEEYNVEVILGTKNSIKNVICDCPFEGGSICKHTVAVLYAILEAKTLVIPLTTNSKTVNKEKKMTFDALLKKIDLHEYQEFVKQFSIKNKAFKEDFELYFSEKDDYFDFEKKYSDIVRRTIKKYTSRGYIDYSSSNRLGKELDLFLNSAKQNSAKQNYRDATTLYQIIIKEVSKVFAFCDDSNGYVRDCVESAIQEINEMLNAPVSFDFKEKINQFLKEEVKKQIYYDYGDFGYNLIETYEEFCIAVHRTDEFLAFLEAKIQSTKKDDYEKRFLIQNKISFLNRIGKKEQVQKLIEENLEIPEIRKLEVNIMIKKQDYETAKKLIADGIKIAEAQNHRGTVYEWEKTLLEIAVLEKNIEIERYFSKKFAFDGGLNSTYYNQWKNTFSKEEWKNTIEDIISAISKKIKETIQKNSFFGKHVTSSNLLYHLGPIYVQENYLDRLLELVKDQENISNVLAYYNILLKQYPNELLDILIPLLEKEGDRSSGRSEYKELARKMKSIIKDFLEDKNRILEVAQKLKEKYPRRPAMLEELNKVI